MRWNEMVNRSPTAIGHGLLFLLLDGTAAFSTGAALSSVDDGIVLS